MPMEWKACTATTAAAAPAARAREGCAAWWARSAPRAVRRSPLEHPGVPADRDCRRAHEPLVRALVWPHHEAGEGAVHGDDRGAGALREPRAEHGDTGPRRPQRRGVLSLEDRRPRGRRHPQRALLRLHRIGVGIARQGRPLARRRDGSPLCGLREGGSSEFVAEILRGQGIDARNLEGGMIAWGRGTAARLVVSGSVRVWQINRFGKGCLSYVVAAGQDAVVVDPHRSLDDYRRFLEENRLTLRAVFDTHLHADHISGAPALAAE